jgi:hypothetical protein
MKKITGSENIYSTRKATIPRPPSIDQAMKKAVNWCIEHGVLPDFLKTNGSEVVNMLLTEWNMDKALEVRGREAREEERAKILGLLQSGKRPEEILNAVRVYVSQ